MTSQVMLKGRAARNTETEEKEHGRGGAGNTSRAGKETLRQEGPEDGLQR